jgi:hypothetical protein
MSCFEQTLQRDAIDGIRLEVAHIASLGNRSIHGVALSIAESKR